MKSSPRRKVAGVTTLAIMPPLFVFLGVSVGGFANWDVRPLLIGSALWVTIAIVFASIAIRRLDRQ